jgi:arylformamidase
MPFILSAPISESVSPLWFEEFAYKKENLYSIQEGKLPPVHYDTHTLNAHSLTHLEAETHVTSSGKSIDYYFENPASLFGPTVVVRLKGDGYKELNQIKGIYHWKVTKVELEAALTSALKNKPFPGKILLTTEFYPLTSYGYHDPNYVLTLTPEAAEYLTSFTNFNLYGTSWKSTDFEPGSKDRPIHKLIFKKGPILECLSLKDVSEGIYFLSAFPLRISGASESPVCPVLFTKEEMLIDS